MSASTEVQSVFHGQRQTSASAPRGRVRFSRDGIIVVSEVLNVVRIRTGETGAAAL